MRLACFALCDLRDDARHLPACVSIFAGSGIQHSAQPDWDKSFGLRTREMWLEKVERKKVCSVSAGLNISRESHNAEA